MYYHYNCLFKTLVLLVSSMKQIPCIERVGSTCPELHSANVFA